MDTGDVLSAGYYEADVGDFGSFLKIASNYGKNAVMYMFNMAKKSVQSESPSKAFTGDTVIRFDDVSFEWGHN